VSFATITLCVASQRVFIIVVYFVIDSVRKILDTPSYITTKKTTTWVCLSVCLWNCTNRQTDTNEFIKIKRIVLQIKLQNFNSLAVTKIFWNRQPCGLIFLDTVELSSYPAPELVLFHAFPLVGRAILMVCSSIQTLSTLVWVRFLRSRQQIWAAEQEEEEEEEKVQISDQLILPSTMTGEALSGHYIWGLSISLIIHCTI